MVQISSFLEESKDPSQHRQMLVTQGIHRLSDSFPILLGISGPIVFFPPVSHLEVVIC